MKMKLICSSLLSVTILTSVTTICSAAVPYRSTNAQETLYNQSNLSMNAQDFYENARELRRLDQTEAALAAFTKAIELNPDYFEAYCYRGAAFVINDQPLEAIKDIEKAANLLNARGEPDKAQVMLKFADDIREGIKAGDFDQ